MVNMFSYHVPHMAAIFAVHADSPAGSACQDTYESLQMEFHQTRAGACAAKKQENGNSGAASQVSRSLNLSHAPITASSHILVGGTPFIESHGVNQIRYCPHQFIKLYEYSSYVG